jgi:hypothetical protein
MNPTVYTEDGMVYHFRPNIVNIEDDATKTYYVIASTIEDRNGNTMTYTTDTSGRPFYPQGLTGSNPFTVSGLPYQTT